MPQATIRDQLLAFNELEVTARRLFHDDSARNRDPVSLLREILPHVSPSPPPDAGAGKPIRRIPEAAFLRGDADVAVVKHIRYLPVVPHTHEFIELSYVYEGASKHALDDGSSFEMERGDLTIVPPGLGHGMAVFDDDTIVVNILIRRSTFDRAFFGLLTDNDSLAEYFARLMYGPVDYHPCIRLRTGDNPKVRQIVEEIVEEAQESRRYRTRMLNLLVMQLCTALIGDHERDMAVMGKTTVANQARAYEVLSYLDSNYQDSTLRTVADHFGFTEGYVSRLVRSATGRTFGDLIRDFRVRRAAELLANPNLPIEEVVRLVGYSEVSHFYRTFKRFYGTTPAEYRKQHQRES